MLAGAVIRLFGALTEGEFKPLEVQLMNETGAPMERYLAVYGCPTILGMPRYAGIRCRGAGQTLAPRRPGTAAHA